MLVIHAAQDGEGDVTAAGVGEPQSSAAPRSGVRLPGRETSPGFAKALCAAPLAGAAQGPAHTSSSSSTQTVLHLLE